MIKGRKLTIRISDSIGKVSAEIIEPEGMKALLVLAHGAGAGMDHSFMVSLSQALGARSIGSIRFNFSYIENGKKRPDVPAVATKTISLVIQKAHELFPLAPLFAGGKSFGGRMTSQLLAKDDPGFLKGVVFYGFPLHAPGKEGMERADHLKMVKIPMLFLQGTNDALADLGLIKKVCKGLKNSTLETFDGANHSFKAGKKVFLDELADVSAKWMDS